MTGWYGGGKKYREKELKKRDWAFIFWTQRIGPFFKKFIIKRDWDWVNEDVYGIDQYYKIIVHIDQ